MTFKVFSKIFLTYLEKPVCSIHARHILFFYSYLQKVFLPTITILEMESERKISLSFGIIFAV